jgi:hypothetical protein
MTECEPWRMMPHEFAATPGALNVPRGSILGLRPETITRESLSRHPAPELSALARVLGVPHSGDRAALLDRILAAVKIRSDLAGATVGRLKKLPVRELRRWLKSLSQYAPPSRYGLAAALVGWRDRCRAEGRAALARANHYRHVRRAVRTGLPVPAEVLACYPDLTAAGDPRPLFDRDTDDEKTPQPEGRS